MSRPTPIEIEASGFKKAVPPEPKIYPQCRNCKSFAYDSDDRTNSRGELTLRRIHLRCSSHQFSVQMGTVCSNHAFAYAHQGDK